MGRLLALCAGALTILAAGCGLDLGDAPFYCCKECKPQCPDGYECKSNVCVKNGACPDSVPGCKNKPVCGNGSCETGEDSTSCPADCKSATCGDSQCTSGETCSSCPKDCGACGTCGNGKCEAGENATTCPADCSTPSCTGSQTQCESTTRLKYCENNVWKSDSCDNLCKAGGYQYSAGCEYSTQSSKYVCVCGNYVGFGAVCSEKIKCQTSLFCGVFQTGQNGFCTKYCTTPNAACSGAPSGTEASCVLDISGQYACGFLCDYASCPSGLKCEWSTSLCKP